ncbi:MAG TPA: acyltransferase family protein [Methylotenera sp.]|jgi:peptidoglycan/LPS O-acetylase OafA/YrhL
MVYRREIDGLRALAVVPVILFHAGFNIFSGGFIGVDVFFVISGYLITSIILTEIQSGTFSIVNFYERRARRILPALFFVMFVCIPFAWTWLSPNDMKEFSKSLRDIPLFVSNILFYKQSGYFDTDSELKPLLHTWSLAVEEQYYIGFPLLVLAMWKYERRLVPYALMGIALFSLIYAQHMLNIEPNAAYFLLLSRIWELMIGSLLAYAVFSKHVRVEKNQMLSLLGLVLLLYAVFFLDKNTPFPGLYALLPTFGAVLLILSATHETFAGKLLGSRLFVGVGLISYSAYLWHQPIFAFAKQRSLEGPDNFLLGLLALATIAIAYFSWKYIEQPFRNKRQFSRKQIFLFGALGSMMFILIGLVGRSTNGFEHRIPSQVLTPINKALESKEVRSKCWNRITENPSISNVCDIGKSSQKPTFALFGDSHAGSIEPALHKKSMESERNGKNYTYAACQPIFSAIDNKSHIKESTCEIFRADFLNHLQTNLIPETIIVSARWAQIIEARSFDNEEGGKEAGAQELNQSYADKNATVHLRMNAYINSLRVLLDSGRKIVLIYPIPEMGWNVPRKMLRLYALNGEITKDDASINYSIFLKRNLNAYRALDSLGTHENLIRIYPEKVLCNIYVLGRCVAHVDGNPIYYDDDHLSEFGAALIVNEISKSLRW